MKLMSKRSGLVKRICKCNEILMSPGHAWNSRVSSWHYIYLSKSLTIWLVAVILLICSGIFDMLIEGAFQGRAYEAKW